MISVCHTTFILGTILCDTMIAEEQVLVRSAVAAVLCDISVTSTGYTGFDELIEATRSCQELCNSYSDDFRSCLERIVA